MIVVDTNIIAYHWLPQTRSGETDKLFQLDPEWAAPLLWRSELRNVLAGYLRRGHMNATTAETVMRKAADSLLGGEHLVTDATVLDFVIRSKCSAYDCEFIALAHGLGVLLVTEDKALLTHFPRQCRSLKNAIRTGLEF